MTAPIQEPTQGRVDANQSWQTRSLFRRPAPAPGAALKLPWGQMFISSGLGDSAQTITNNTSTLIEMKNFFKANDPDDCIQTGDISTINNAPDDTYMWLKPGLYLIGITAQFNETTAFESQLAYGGMYPINASLSAAAGLFTQLRPADPATDRQQMVILGWQSSTVLAPVVYCQVRQESGSDKNANECGISAIKVSDFAGADFEIIYGF